MPRFLSFALVVLVLAPLPAAADEAWTSKHGKIVYQSERDGAALLYFDHPDGSQAMLVVPGLAGNYTDRGVHEAYWVGTGEGTCDALLAITKGHGAHHWGRARIAFDKPAFPTDFTMMLGDCFGPLDRSIRAERP